MSILQRPAPPLRSYTETVQADVDEATSSSLFGLSLADSSPLQINLDPTTTTPDQPEAATTRRRRAPTFGNGDQRRRRRSNDEMRLPPTALGVSTAASEHDARNGSTEMLMGSSIGTNERMGIRRANSTDLLSFVGDYEEDEDSDAGFSSEVSLSLSLVHVTEV
jgi:hypothetical protein